MPLQLREKRFTIIEMIWVIVVIAIILGMGAAAMTGIGTHKGSEGGARMMARMLELSRQYAISKNARVALIMPMSDATGSGSYSVGDYDYHSDTWSRDFSQYMPDATDCATNDTPSIIVRPAVVDKNNNFVEWVKGSEWVRLPGGIYFSGNYPSDPKLGVYECDEIKNVHMPNVGGYVTTNVSVHGLIFKSTGSTTQVEDAVIEVKPYSINSTQSNYDPGSASVYEISVNWLTGKITTVQKKKIEGNWRTIN